MATSDHFRRVLLDGLYDDARKGRGTDISVEIPSVVCKNGNENDDTNAAANIRGGGLCSSSSAAAETLVSSPTASVSKRKTTTTYHLHYAIVASSSEYFATFPEPKSGRIISDVDVESFSFCVKFFYTGGCEDLSHDNVASILHASELLQIDELKQKCIDFLGNCLDHDNYEHVIELADRFNCPKLKEDALRFQTANSSRDTLLAKSAALARELDAIRQEQSKVNEREKKTQKNIDQVDEQLKEIYKKEHEEMLASKWEKSIAGNNNDSSTIPNALGSIRKPGSIGHLVQAIPEGYPYETYDGSSRYGDNVGENVTVYDIEDYEYNYHSRLVYCDKTNDGAERYLPPSPTKDQYEKYGIVYAHDSIITAIKKANPGDRIYLAPGKHWDGEEYNEHIRIKKSLEFIGLGAKEDVIVEVDYDNAQPFEILGVGSVGFYDITFRAKEADPDEVAKKFQTWQSGHRFLDSQKSQPAAYAHGTGEDAIICFGEDAYDPCSHKSRRADYVVKDCDFEMGLDSRTAFPTRVSGIFLKRGKSATIEGCTFCGGAGSAIVALNDPFWYTETVNIRGNQFLNNGQPSFRERDADKYEDVTLGPSSIELWRFNRKFYKAGIYDDYVEKLPTVKIDLVENQIASNLRAPLTQRTIHPNRRCPDGTDTHDWGFRILKNLKDKGGKVGGIDGFSLTLRDNTMKNNGLQFTSEWLVGMKHAEHMHTNRKKHCKLFAFPDGDTLLLSDHYMCRKDERSFPDSWVDGLPFERFMEDFVAREEWDF